MRKKDFQSLLKYNIELRLVEEEDSEFIISIRTNEQRNRFISHTDLNIEKQRQWISNYKKREAEGKEYYFIALDELGNRFSTYRVYNFESDTVEIGSWVTAPNYQKFLNSIKVDIIMKEFVFDVLKFESLNFNVRKNNLSVLRYHKLFNPIVVKETDLDVFFVLNRDDFYEQRNKKFFNIK